MFLWTVYVSLCVFTESLYVLLIKDGCVAQSGTWAAPLFIRKGTTRNCNKCVSNKWNSETQKC